LRPSALRICNARTSTRLRKLWVSSHSWNSESLPTPSPPLPHVLARARLTSTVYVSENINRIMLRLALCCDFSAFRPRTAPAMSRFHNINEHGERGVTEKHGSGKTLRVVQRAAGC
jgi:hypothetical protein